MTTTVAKTDTGLPPTVQAPTATRSRRADLLLWVLQAVVALLLVAAGLPKMIATDRFIEMSPWAADVPRALLLFIGIMEVLGAIGVVLPRLTKIAPFLTPLAALGLLTIMVLSIAFHFWRGEWNVGFNVVLGILAGIVAYGRYKWVP